MEISPDRARAFETYRASYPGNDVITEQKATLRALCIQAKEVGEGASVAKSAITRLKVALYCISKILREHMLH